MRLIRLRMKNIASLKGEHEVNFLEIERQSSLFAITGETGSGKSSILNAIGLSLYGQIYKKNVNQLDVVTLGEKDGSIELIIQVRDKFYLADWRAKVLKQNGEPYSTPQTPTRNLYLLDGHEFDSPKKISEKNAPELLNLDFDQFCKCIILNQGEFARFLTSSFTDRKDILEKLYPGEILESMGKTLKLEVESLEASRKELEIKLGELQGETISGADLKQEKKNLEIELKKYDEGSRHFEKLDYHFVSLNTYFEKYQENELRQENIKKEMSDLTSRYNLLLKDGEKIQAQYQEAKIQQEKEAPRLQEFLKKEENLKAKQDEGQKLSQRAVEIKKNINLEKNKKNSIEEKIRGFNLELQVLQKKITRPIDILKTHHQKCQELFDTFSEKELKGEEIKGKESRLKELAQRGKELKEVFQNIEKELSLIPEDVKELEKTIEIRKKELQKEQEAWQKAHIKKEELILQVRNSEELVQSFKEKLNSLSILLKKTMDDIFPLETTIKMEEILHAQELCVNHAETNNVTECPVCEQSVDKNLWGNLKLKLMDKDLTSIKKTYEDLKLKVMEIQKETEFLSERIKTEEESHSHKLKDIETLELTLAHKLPSMEELDKELEGIRKKVWDQEKLKKDFATKDSELQVLRKQYKALETELKELSSSQEVSEKRFALLSEAIKEILSEVNRDTIRDLKLELKDFNKYLEMENTLEKARVELGHVQEILIRYESNEEEILSANAKLIQEISSLETELMENLKGEKASVLLTKLQSRLKEAEAHFSKQSEEQKKEELKLKDAQGRLYQLTELKKDYELHFIKELETIKVLAQNKTSLTETDELLSKLTDFEADLSTSKEIIISLKDHISSQKESLKSRANEIRMNFASISTRLTEWEKIQDKIKLFELQARDIKDQLDRKMRLFEVLGKDDLRTFVLSLVEENLIYQTNEELQKLCQGRYEIIHQTKSLKMTPEFYILDKFREGGKRKVTTLSGGETFMVSLAMALGLAEMTRGQAEIDSLFIDEGFGTLDQDSLQDVLEVLNQIQTRGLMVGIISHIKTLTSAIPVNLLLTKKQDGCSTVSVLAN